MNVTYTRHPEIVLKHVRLPCMSSQKLTRTGMLTQPTYQEDMSHGQMQGMSATSNFKGQRMKIRELTINIVQHNLQRNLQTKFNSTDAE